MCLCVLTEWKSQSSKKKKKIPIFKIGKKNRLNSIGNGAQELKKNPCFMQCTHNGPSFAGLKYGTLACHRAVLIAYL